MKLKRTHIALLAVALLLTIVTYKARAWNQDPPQEPVQRRPAESARENMTRNQLNSLLNKVGVFVAELPVEAPDHRRLTVHWKSGTGDGKSMRTELTQQQGILTFTGSAPRAGAVPVPRNVELSTTQTLVIAVDESQQLVWWNQFSDPRIVRAEVPDANGQQNLGRTFYLDETDFAVAYPNNPAIRDVRFYQPLWDGKEFQLKLIGSVSVNNL
jgi:hypothetical protein